MQQEVKIIFYPEISKSNNGALFESLMRIIFEKEGYELDQNQNFTGLEIDLWGNHTSRKEKLLIECKAKQKPLSTEIRNFAFNVVHKKATYGYFLYTEELDHHAGGLVQEMVSDSDKRYEKLIFFEPDKIISTLIKARFLKNFDAIEWPDSVLVKKVIFAYTYFGNYYVFIASSDASNKFYYLFDALTMKEITNVDLIADEGHSEQITIEQALKNTIHDIYNLKHRILNPINEKILPEALELNADFIKFLEDTGAQFISSRTDEIKLNDIFVEPNLKKLETDKLDKKLDIVKLSKITKVEKEEENLNLIIIGDDTSGKTTVCKKIYFQYYSEGFVPILLNGHEINNIRKDLFDKEVLQAFYRQYNATSLSESNRGKMVLIIDDFHNFKNIKKDEYRDVLVKNINSSYSKIILMGDNLMPLEVLAKDTSLKNTYNDYTIYQLLEFGPKLRHELVKKWNNIGKDIDLIDLNELFRKYDELEKHIESIIGKNYIPAYPFYILTILQTLEGSIDQRPNYSLHGFYYEHLINQKLYETVKNRDDISLFYNYTTEFSFFLFQLKRKSITIADFGDFHSLYCSKYEIKYSVERLVSGLRNAKLVIEAV